MNILFLCTGNSCRSQMAEGLFKHEIFKNKTLDGRIQILSAGVKPEKEVNPIAVKVMAESGIDISSNYPKNVDQFINMPFDYVITLCDSAKESCPVFTGNVKHQMHVPFPDPADIKGSEDIILQGYRQIRDMIKKEFQPLIAKVIKIEENTIKAMVKDRYGRIARSEMKESCCGTASLCCGSTAESYFSIMADDYKNLDGYYKDADLGLGCGVPTEFALMQEGHTVLDLGSGAGNDVFVARRQVGENGKVFGIDMTDEMIEKARQNAVKLGYDNVEFVKGDIENMPLNNNLVDVVISNCVLNLVPDKDKAFSEIYRVMKPGGHFSISDIVLKGFLPDNVKMVAEMYAGCISGALQMEDYIGIVEKTGFKNIKVQKSKKIQIEDEVLNKFMSKEEIDAYRSKEVGVLSITLYAEK